MFQILMVLALALVAGGCAAQERTVLVGYRMVVREGGAAIGRKPDSSYETVPYFGEKKPETETIVYPREVVVEKWYEPVYRQYYVPSYSGLSYQSYPLFGFRTYGYHGHHHYHGPKYCPLPPCPRPHAPKPCPPKKR